MLWINKCSEVLEKIDNEHIRKFLLENQSENLSISLLYKLYIKTGDYRKAFELKKEKILLLSESSSLSILEKLEYAENCLFCLNKITE